LVGLKFAAVLNRSSLTAFASHWSFLPFCPRGAAKRFSVGRMYLEIRRGERRDRPRGKNLTVAPSAIRRIFSSRGVLQENFAPSCLARACPSALLRTGAPLASGTLVSARPGSMPAARQQSGKTVRSSPCGFAPRQDVERLCRRHDADRSPLCRTTPCAIRRSAAATCVLRTEATPTAEHCGVAEVSALMSPTDRSSHVDHDDSPRASW